MSYAFPSPPRPWPRTTWCRWPSATRAGCGWGDTQGGNLAVWAALHAPPLLRRRILRVTSHDAPALARTSPAPGPTEPWPPGWSPISPRPPWWGPFSTRTPGPRSSRATGWGRWASTTPSPGRCGGTGFVSLPRRSRRGDRRAPGSGAGWTPCPRRSGRSSPRSFFDLLAASRAETLSEFSQSWADSALAVAGAYAALPPAVRRDMLDYLWRFLVNMGTGEGVGGPGAVGTAGLPGQGGPCGFLPTPLERQGTLACPAGAPFLGKKWGKRTPEGRGSSLWTPFSGGVVWGRLYFLRDTRPAALTAKARNGPPTGWAGWGRG